MGTGIRRGPGPPSRRYRLCLLARVAACAAASETARSAFAKARLGVGTVQCDQRSVETRLVEHILAEQRLAYGAVDVGDGLPDAFAEIARLVPVAELHGLARTGGRARGHGRTPRNSCDQHIRLDGRIAA